MKISEKLKELEFAANTLKGIKEEGAVFVLFYGNSKATFGHNDLKWNLFLVDSYTSGVDLNKLTKYYAQDEKLSGAIQKMSDAVGVDLEIEFEEDDENCEDEDLDDDYDDCSSDDDDGWDDEDYTDSSDLDYKVVEVDGRKFKLTPID
jgi:hypothetical protein